MSETTRHDLEAHLPNPPGAIRRWLAEHPRAVDNFILVCYFIGAIPLAGISVFAASEFDFSIQSVVAYSVLVLVRVSAGAVALIFRRRAPLLGLILVTFALIGDTSPVVAATGVALWFMLYAVPVYRDVKTGWIAYGIAVTGSFIGRAIEPLVGDIGGFSAIMGGSAIVDTIIDAIFLLVVLLIGINLGNRRRYLAAIIDRAHQLARERDQLALLAVAEERSRLSREIHDIVAHSVSVMIALSEGSARVVEAAPAEAANAMQRSAETGRTALAEMRRLFGALQASEAAELAPQPGMGDIPALIAGFDQAGLTVSFVDETVDHGDRLQGLAIYRVVQEGLTNALRYAGVGANAAVTMRTTEQFTEVSVRDFGRPAGAVAQLASLGSGRGLAGLAERVRVFGGTIESGPVPEEPGWKLTARFPNEQVVTNIEESRA